MKLLLVLPTLYYSISAATASGPIEATVAELYARSTEVAALTITKGAMINVGDIRCGARYTAHIERSFKGSSSEITFDSYNGLEIGANYLIFFKKNDGPDPQDAAVRSPQQRALCPEWTGPMTPDLTYGKIQQTYAGTPPKEAYEIYGAFIQLPKTITTNPPKRYNTDGDYGTVWADKNDVLEYLQKLSEDHSDGT